jgi:hypothetical protein
MTIGDRRVRRRRRVIAIAFETVLTDVLRPAYAFTARAPVARGQVFDAVTNSLVT